MTPTTKAGRALIEQRGARLLAGDAGPEAWADFNTFEGTILAIEAEARQQERERIRAALEDEGLAENPDDSQFEVGAKAAYNYVLSILDGDDA